MARSDQASAARSGDPGYAGRMEPRPDPVARRPRPVAVPTLAAALIVALVAAACAGPDPTARSVDPGAPASSSAIASAPTDPTGTPLPTSAPTPTELARVPADPPPLALTVLASGLRAPLDVAVRPVDPDALYVVEQAGRIVVVRDGVVGARPFLDIAGQVTAGGEQGLLGLAFHRDRTDDRLFVYYTSVDGSQVVSSFRAPADAGAVVDPATETVILRMPDRFANHNGGGLTFGLDGMLYIATGDGGGGGDPLGSGRDLTSLLGKILRIDVTTSGRGAGPYAIPDDNPYADDSAARPETWASGLRNPWRIRTDRATGDLWIGDVGQNAWEEIDVHRAGAPGGANFGWNVMEGGHCYSPRTGCDQTGLVLPITEYGRDGGDCTVIGGAVYRGTEQAALAGGYLFGDYCTGRLWAIDPAGEALREPTVVGESGRNLTSFGEDEEGELYATDVAAGALVRVVATRR